MERRSFISLIKRIFIPAPQADEETRRQASALSHLFLLLLAACSGLAVIEWLGGEKQPAAGLAAAAVLLLGCLLLVHSGKFALPSRAAPAAILAVNLYILSVGRGIHDIATIGLPMNIALAGLLLGKRGVIGFTILGFLGLTGIYLAESAGSLEKALPFRELTTPSDLFIMGTILLTTGALIFLAIYARDCNIVTVRQWKTEFEKRVDERTRELQSSNVRLTAISRVKDDFVANISHELRTPLTSINLHLGLLCRRPESIEQHIEQLRREAGRLEHLIDDLLTLSRLDQDRVPVKSSPLDLNHISEQFLVDRSPIASSRQINLLLEQQANLPCIEADGRMIEQVLSILLTNAVDYTPSGGKVILRTWETQINGERWVGFSVIDNGPGITIEEQAHIFERFYRGRVGHESKVPGTGLGLAIAREIIRRHHGQIEVQSTGVPGEGTTFRVWLPLPPEQT